MKSLLPCLVGFSILTLSACATDYVAPPPPNAVPILAQVETEPVSSRGDSADDPAIWLNASSIEESLIIGTDKNFGLEVYDLSGRRVQRISAGRTNNVDLRYLDDNRYWSAVVAASNRTTNTISLFLVNHQGELEWIQSSEIETGLAEPYGLCMYKDAAGLQVFVNDTDGSYQQWLLEGTNDLSLDVRSLSGRLVREFGVNSQPEGCVADDINKRLFVGVEAEGVKTLDADFSAPVDLNSIINIDGVILVADVEGLSLYKQNNNEDGYLIVSSQGNYSYSVYDRVPPHSYRGSFVVADNADIDGSQETDGLSVSSELVTPSFPSGMLVVQDGFNTLPAAPQNFKYVSWADIASSLELE